MEELAHGYKYGFFDVFTAIRESEQRDGSAYVRRQPAADPGKRTAYGDKRRGQAYAGDCQFHHSGLNE